MPRLLLLNFGPSVDAKRWSLDSRERTGDREKNESEKGELGEDSEVREGRKGKERKGRKVSFSSEGKGDSEEKRAHPILQRDLVGRLKGERLGKVGWDVARK